MERKPPPPELAELRALVTRRDALERMRTQEMNRFHVDRAGIQRKTDDDANLKKQRELLDSVPGLGVKTIPSCPALFLQWKTLQQSPPGGGLRRS